jgi:hypothetical protein
MEGFYLRVHEGGALVGQLLSFVELPTSPLTVAESRPVDPTFFATWSRSHLLLLMSGGLKLPIVRPCYLCDYMQTEGNAAATIWGFVFCGFVF